MFLRLLQKYNPLHLIVYFFLSVALALCFTLLLNAAGLINLTYHQQINYAFALLLLIFGSVVFELSHIWCYLTSKRRRFDLEDLESNVNDMRREWESIKDAS
jgi:hypothetical protein